MYLNVLGQKYPEQLDGLFKTFPALNRVFLVWALPRKGQYLFNQVYGTSLNRIGDLKDGAEPTWEGARHVERAILVGTPNAGSAHPRSCGSSRAWQRS